MDYYTIFDNFSRGFWQEQGDRPNGSKCNLGRFQPRAVTPLVDWSLYRATHAALERIDYIDRRYFVLTAVGMADGTRYKPHQAIERIHRECLLNMRPYSRKTIDERFSRLGVIAYQNELSMTVEKCLNAAI